VLKKISTFEMQYTPLRLIKRILFLMFYDTVFGNFLLESHKQFPEPS